MMLVDFVSAPVGGFLLGALIYRSFLSVHSSAVNIGAREPAVSSSVLLLSSSFSCATFTTVKMVCCFCINFLRITDKTMLAIVREAAQITAL